MSLFWVWSIVTLFLAQWVSTRCIAFGLPRGKIGLFTALLSGSALVAVPLAMLLRIWREGDTINMSRTASLGDVFPAALFMLIVFIINQELDKEHPDTKRLQRKARHWACGYAWVSLIFVWLLGFAGSIAVPCLVVATATLVSLGFVLMNAPQELVRLHSVAHQVSNFGLKEFARLDHDEDGVVDREDLWNFWKTQAQPNELVMLQHLADRITEIGHVTATNVYYRSVGPHIIADMARKEEVIRYVYGIALNELQTYPSRFQQKWASWL